MHRIGKSTINQGITVPVDCQDSWMAHIDRGQSVHVSFSIQGEEFTVDLRRIDNDSGHLQFRYERKEHHFLREYFSSLSANDTCVVEIIEIEQGRFQAVPITVRDGNKPCLSIYRPICHHFGQEGFGDSPEFLEIIESVKSIDFVQDDSQRDYNFRIHRELSSRHWLTEEKVHDVLGLKCDFFKEGIWLEVEFGNARSYYQDYIKFLIAAKYRYYRYGVLLCPTSSFANYLCDLGRQRARQKSDRTRPVSYSGMMTYEKAVRELPFLEHVLDRRVVIAGLDVSSIAPHGVQESAIHG